MAVEIIVVDNQSSDDSRSYLEPRFPAVQFIWLDANPGFARSCNMGLEKAIGKYVLFLNPDTLVPEDCFEKLAAFFQQHNKAGAVGVRMLDGRGKFLSESKRGFPTTRAAFFKFSGMARRFPRSAFFAAYYLGHLGEQEVNEVDVLSGACMALPRQLATMLGGFDEAYFMYGEDIDLSYRVNRAGYRNYYFPGITIIHFKGESTQKKSASYIRNFYGAMGLFVRKHYSRFQAFLYTIPIQMIIAIKSMVRWLDVGRRKNNESKDLPGCDKLIVIGGEAEGQIGALLYLKSNPHGMLPGGDIVYASAWDKKLASLQYTQKTDILFCIGELSLGKAIGMLQELTINGNILFYFANSGSIIGRSAK